MIYVLAWAGDWGRWYVMTPTEADATYFDADGNDRWHDIKAANDACERLNGVTPRKRVRV